jgi:hypothetical protein
VSGNLRVEGERGGESDRSERDRSGREGFPRGEALRDGEKEKKKSLGSVEEMKEKKDGTVPVEKEMSPFWIFCDKNLCDHLRIKTNYFNQIDKLNHS